MDYKALNNGLKMPMVGLGVYNISERETQRVVEDALSVGYRSIDTAAMYYNEKGVGDAVKASAIPRDELFITTKICDSCYTREETLRSVDHSMKLLGLDYVDLMLIHWPVGNPTVSGIRSKNSTNKVCSKPSAYRTSIPTPSPRLLMMPR